MNKYVIVCLVLIMVLSCSESKRAIKKPLGQIITPYGEMLFEFHEETPNHKASFIKLAKNDYWDFLTFNRVIKDFVIQGGCPDTPEGFNESHYLIQPEFNDSLKHIYGAVGMGRDNNSRKMSAGCQFYIVNNKKGLPFLDGDYMIFGQLIKGFDVLEKISNLKTDSTDKPLNDVSIKVDVIYCC